MRVTQTQRRQDEGKSVEFIFFISGERGKVRASGNLVEAVRSVVFPLWGVAGGLEQARGRPRRHGTARGYWLKVQRGQGESSPELSSSPSASVRDKESGVNTSIIGDLAACCVLPWPFYSLPASAGG